MLDKYTGIKRFFFCSNKSQQKIKMGTYFSIYNSDKNYKLLRNNSNKKVTENIEKKTYCLVKTQKRAE